MSERPDPPDHAPSADNAEPAPPPGVAVGSVGSPPPPAEAPAPHAPAADERLHRGALTWALMSGGLALLGLLVGALAWQKAASMAEPLARQSMDSGAKAVEARALAQQAQEITAQSAARVAALEARVADLTAQRAQVDTLVASLTRVSDDTLLVDLESGLRLAQGQAQLTGSAAPLLAALKSADQRIARSANARAVSLRRVIARDMERIQSTAVTDTPAVLGRLDELIRQVDDLPATNAVARSDGGASAAAATSEAPGGWVDRLWRSVVAQTLDLVQVDRVDDPDAVLMSPEQAFFMREHLKLRLQGVRLALLARQPEAVRSDLAAASTMLKVYFAPASRRTQAAASALQQIQTLAADIAVPSAAETLNALASLSAAPATAPGAAAR